MRADIAAAYSTREGTGDLLLERDEQTPKAPRKTSGRGALAWTERSSPLRSPAMTKSRPHVTIESLMAQALEVPGLLSLAAGFTDNAALPAANIGHIISELLSSDAGRETLQYGNPQGRAALRRYVADRLQAADQRFGVTAPGPNASDVIITTGSQQALSLLVLALCRPGDAVLVEAPTYFVFLELLAELDIEPIFLPSRDDSLDVEALPTFLSELRRDGRAERVRATYLVSYFSNPTCLSLSATQKNALLTELREADLCMPVIEDVAYREFYFEREWPAPSLISQSTPDMPVAVVGTFTKTFSTGLKVGHATISDADLRRRVQGLKRVSDFGTSNFAQAIVERAVAGGDYDEHLEEMRPHYGRKCTVLDTALRDGELDQLGWQWQKSDGGLYLWVGAPPGLSTAPDSEFFNACLEEKVSYVPGSMCGAQGERERVRLTFGYPPDDELRTAATRFVAAARRFR